MSSSRVEQLAPKYLATLPPRTRAWTQSQDVGPEFNPHVLVDRLTMELRTIEGIGVKRSNLIYVLIAFRPLESTIEQWALMIQILEREPELFLRQKTVTVGGVTVHLAHFTRKEVIALRAQLQEWDLFKAANRLLANTNKKWLAP